MTRIHFAIVCASVGCPRLRNEAYTGAKLAAAARHVPDPADQAFLKRTDLTIEFLDYDWSINAQPQRDEATRGD